MVTVYPNLRWLKIYLCIILPIMSGEYGIKRQQVKGGQNKCYLHSNKHTFNYHSMK